MLLTRLPLSTDPSPSLVQALKTSLGYFVRLACLRHAASVHPEPGSNSPKKNNFLIFETFVLTNF